MWGLSGAYGSGGRGAGIAWCGTTGSFDIGYVGTGHAGSLVGESGDSYGMHSGAWNQFQYGLAFVAGVFAVPTGNGYRANNCVADAGKPPTSSGDPIASIDRSMGAVTTTRAPESQVRSTPSQSYRRLSGIL